MLMAPLDEMVTEQIEHQWLDPAANAHDEIDHARLSIRVAIVGEAGSTELLIWSELLQHDISVCRASENYIADIAPSRFDYDVLLIAGSDPKRIKRLLRCYAPALARRPKVALTKGNSPSERASLLRAGFDDVFDTRMPMPEARARMRAMVQRYGIARAHAPASAAVETAPDYGPHLVAPATGSERALLEMLLAANGRSVPATMLAGALGRNEPLKLATIKVIVSTLRKKLRKGADIRSDRQAGYLLSLDGNDGQAGPSR